MSDRTPYDDSETGHGRRGRRRRPPEGGSDPLTDPWPRTGPPAAGGRQVADPLTDPWPARASAHSRPVVDPLTDPWPGRAEPGRPGPGTDLPTRPSAFDSEAELPTRPRRWSPDAGAPAAPADTDPAARPRGRRHRAPEAPDDAGTGPHTAPSAAVEDTAAPRGRRRRGRVDEAEEHLAWTRPAPGEDEEFHPVPPRTLDFDSVPVRRKRPRDTDDDARSGRRRRRAETNPFPAADPEPDDGRGRRRRRAETDPFPAEAAPEDDQPAGRRRRRGDTGPLPAADDPAPRGGRRRRGADTDPFGADADPAAPRRAEGAAGGGHRRDRHDTGALERYPDFVAQAGFASAAAPAEAAPGEAGTDLADEPAPRGRRARGGDPDGRAAAPARRRRARGADPGPDDTDTAEEHGAAPADDEDDDRPRRSRRGGRRAARAGSAPDPDGETPAPGGRRAARRARTARSRPRKGVTVVVALALVTGVGAGGFALGRTYLFPPDYEGEGSGSVEIVVEEGATGQAIADELVAQGVVASPGAFLNALGSHGGNVAPGTYRLHEQMSGDAAVELLMDPSARLQAHITFKEGLRADEVLRLLHENTGIPMEELRAALEDTEALGLPDYAEQGAEGYLFPDTYDMPADADASALLRRMVDRFHEVAEDVDLEDAAAERNLTPNEAMAVAAIVQAESGSAEDMPKVARVVYNRLEAVMELGMDSTCFYVIGEYGIALTNDQLAECKAADSEYATYGRTGLPAGPIVSPGRQAIEAALNPAEGEWLYFVATDPENGVTEFAETYEEFEQLKLEFEQNRGDL
ncbi:UPF0755 protein [Streptomonospora nanhaiensis]|uniref:Endolytic murein transglycosylase n=3 Tax=Streptomonospora nanhaiensis TaxID=1323731 RepID=A0A853BU60_9ACTN|nr:endolytic transglycosylase MltG [Streptomonospora nanhaiensis]NYI98828.1 UPF0755 protein [Streptomonospora nanhaiensis]